MSIFKHRHFENEIIIWAVRWYCKYGISYRELEEMLGERGVEVDHSTIYRWVQCYAPKMLDKLRWYYKPQLGYSGVVANNKNLNQKHLYRGWP